MPDGLTPRGPRGGFPQGGRGAPRGGPRGGGPRGGFPTRPRRPRRFPRFFVFPSYGFPRERCYWIDRYGRCCDRYGRCCDRYGRCEYYGDYDVYPTAGLSDAMDGWYGIPGSWDMVPEMDDMTDYYEDDE